MSLPPRPLRGFRVGLSVSGSDDLAARGVSSAGMNRLTLRFAKALLDQGCTLAFGHDWRQQGVMEAVCAFATETIEPEAAEAVEPPILNLLPWPDRSLVPPEFLDRLPGILGIRGAGLPPDLAPDEGADGTAGFEQETRRYCRSRGLTHLRRQLVRLTAARICLGGSASGYSGRYPGVVEEAFLALGAGQPVYCVGLLGGAALRLGRAILDGEEIPSGFGETPLLPSEEGGQALAALYRARSEFAQGAVHPEDLEIDLSNQWAWCVDLGPEGLSTLNRLTVAENRRLLETSSQEEAVVLVLRGLGRLKRARR